MFLNNIKIITNKLSYKDTNGTHMHIELCDTVITTSREL
jgi:hypothetical protein